MTGTGKLKTLVPGMCSQLLLGALIDRDPRARACARALSLSLARSFCLCSLALSLSHTISLSLSLALSLSLSGMQSVIAKQAGAKADLLLAHGDKVYI